MSWEEVFAGYLCGLDRKKPVIVCGDLNVAHKEIDLKTQRQTEITLALRMLKGINSQSYWGMALLMRSDIYIRSLRMRIPGGATWRIRGLET